MDPHYEHEFRPNRRGLCQVIVGRDGHCHLPENAPVHQHWAARHAAPIEEEESEVMADTHFVVTVKAHLYTRTHADAVRIVDERLRSVGGTLTSAANDPACLVVEDIDASSRPQTRP